MNERKKLDATRQGFTRKIRLGKFVLYVTVNSDPEGVVREMFVKWSKGGHVEGVEGSLLAFLDTMAKLASRAMQAGVPFGKILQDWRGTRFDPSAIGVGTSPLDAIARSFLETEDSPHGADETGEKK